MPTLKQYRQEAIRRINPALGRVETVGALAAQSVGVTALAVGGISTQRYVNHWILRPDTTASADRSRFCTTYDPTNASVTLTHTGPAYTDTVITGESVEVLTQEPFIYDQAVDQTVRRMHRQDMTIIPARFDTDRYWIGDLGWLEQPADFIKVTFSNDPYLSRNRYFQQWNSVDTSGNLLPDWWTLAGTGGTMARSTLYARRGTYTAAVTRAGTNVTLTQTPGLLENGVDNTLAADSLRGRTVTVVGVGTASSANQLRFAITDGITTNYTSYHSGGGTPEELFVTFSPAAAAATLQIYASVEVDGTVYLSECYDISLPLDNAIRRDTWPEVDVQYDFDQGAGTPIVVFPRGGYPGQYRLYNKRPYPGFDPVRLASGLADGDTQDAPLVIVAAGTIARVYAYLAQVDGTDSKRWASQAQVWEQRFQVMAAEHMGIKAPPANGYPLINYSGRAASRAI